MASSLDTTFAALADPTRLAVIALLREQPLNSSAIAEALATSRPAMSRHLRVLRKAGLVEEDAHGDDARLRVYQLRPEPFAIVRGWVEEVESFWGDQLRSFQRHVEQRMRTAPRARADKSPPGRRR